MSQHITFSCVLNLARQRNCVEHVVILRFVCTAGLVIILGCTSSDDCILIQPFGYSTALFLLGRTLQILYACSTAFADTDAVLPLIAVDYELEISMVRQLPNVRLFTGL